MVPGAGIEPARPFKWKFEAQFFDRQPLLIIYKPWIAQSLLA
jgi:hypothetical protein